MLLALCLILVADAPKTLDPQLKINLFADAPQIVTPTGITVDAKGRVLCIESHTHFRPEGYKGPPADRIRRFEDTDGDGRADKIETIFEGSKHTMALAFGPGGALYIATRNEIFSIPYKDGEKDGGKKTTLVTLDTPGNYPHNGLSGVTFDFDGTLYFGLGENLGADYKLIGSDGTTLKGGGEGGNIYRCKPDGTKLERVATGFWNPFAMTFDAFGRLFAVDNDPDSRPPCRLLQIVEGGDYGYRFRNGRKGLHPFTSWNGELPGTLPMMAGTGEAPSGIVAYESVQFPKLRGDLLATSWGDHRIDRFGIVERPRNGTLKAESSPLVVGGDDFRPVGIVVAPDGSLFVSDWVDKSYDLHGKGRIWRVEARDRPGRVDPSAGLRHPDRLVREAAARRILAEGDEATLRAALFGTGAGDERTRATARRALRASGSRSRATRDVLRLAVAAPFGVMGESPVNPAFAREVLDEIDPAIFQADPFLALMVRRNLARAASVGERCRMFERLKSDGSRLQVLLSLRESADPRAARVLAAALASRDPSIRLVAAMWVAEQGLTEHRERLVESLADGTLTPALFEATLAAIDRLDGGRREANDESGAEGLVARLAVDPMTPASVRRRALRVLRPDHPALTAKVFDELLASPDATLRIEAIRTLRDASIADRTERLLKLATGDRETTAGRAEAVAGLAGPSIAEAKALLELSRDRHPAIREQAVRMAGLPSHPDAPSHPLGEGRSVKDVELAIGEFKTGSGDAEEGGRIFYHPKGPGCYKCHRVEGRGGRVGPDLTATGPATTREKLIRSIVDPDAEIAPQFTTWRIARHDGTQLDGVLVEEAVNGDQTYADAEGRRSTVKAADVAERKPLTTSVMPRDLLAKLNPREVRDLLAYLHRESPAEDNILTPEQEAAGWKMLFDGKTLRGWTTETKAASKIPAQGGTINPHGAGGYMLINEKEFGDFQLSLDFKISPRCNTGVFIRTSPLEPRPGKDIGFNGIEIAIDDTKDADFHDTGAIYDLVKPSRNTMKQPGEWNHLEITCDGPKITVAVNGETVSSINVDEWTEKNKRPDGTVHKFDIAYKEHPRKGFIGLQDHGSDCWYKNIKIRELKK